MFRRVGALQYAPVRLRLPETETNSFADLFFIIERRKALLWKQSAFILPKIHNYLHAHYKSFDRYSRDAIRGGLKRVRYMILVVLTPFFGKLAVNLLG